MIIDASQLARSARFLRWVTLLGILLVAAAMIFGCWVLAVGPQSGGPVRFSVDTDGLTPFPAALVLLTAGTLLIVALVQIAWMLRAAEQGAPFRTGAALRRFALYLFLALLASVLLPTLIQSVLSLAGSRGGHVDFSLSGEELLMLFVTGLLFFVARLLEAAQALSEEHEQIV